MLGAVLVVSVVQAEAENKWVWSGNSRTISGGGSARYYPDEAGQPLYRYCTDQLTLMPDLPNTAKSCGQHGPVTAWFLSARPDNVIPVSKTSILLGA